MQDTGKQDIANTAALEKRYIEVSSIQTSTAQLDQAANKTNLDETVVDQLGRSLGEAG